MISLITLIVGMPVMVSPKHTQVDATLVQLEAMANYRNENYRDGLYFNHRGNINQAKTIKINALNCVFQLGMGRYYCE